MNELILSVYSNPTAWRVDRFYFTHENGVRVWVTNGFTFLAVENAGGFNFWQKVRFYRAFRWWLANAPLECLGAR